MSLTSFLKQSEEVRALLRQQFPCPRMGVAFPSVRASPLTTNYALVGQAFDYLLRFFMQRQNPHAPGRSHWVASWIRATLSGEGEEILQQRKTEAAALPFLEAAYAHHKRYLEDGEVTDELLGSCLDLAIIDGLVRAGEVRGSLGQRDARDLRDLRNLLSLVPPTPFLDGDPVYLNPVFAFPSGADCDLLVGNTLIEIKTTKFSGIKQDHYQQLLGYYLLNFDEKRTYAIQSIGIYFSRHGYLWSVDMEDIASQEAFLRFLPHWNILVERYHHSGRGDQDVASAHGVSAHSLEELVAQVDVLRGPSSYMHWLSLLSKNDFALWKAWPTAAYYVSGALEIEQEKRRR